MQLYLAGEYYKNMGNAVKQIVWGGIVPEVDNESLSCKPAHDTKIQERAQFRNSPIRGGIPDEVKNENISGRASIIADQKYRGFDNIVKTHRPFILESFYYADETTEKLIPFFGDFLLDSGAFTFMGGFTFTKNDKKKVVWEEYIERYADFINRNKVEKFFELDIDSVVGYEKVLYYRKKLEQLTGKPVIPVWHSTRGKDEFIKSCEQYPYVALGGIVGGEWKASAEKAIPWFINTAHKNNAKIHGLGYTKLDKLREYHFDSVDSTAWTTGNRFGFVYQFNGQTMIKHNVPKGKRLADSKRVAEINYTEWIKFQRYADIYL